MFQLNCRANFRLIFEKVECTIANAFKLCMTLLYIFYIVF